MYYFIMRKDTKSASFVKPMLVEQYRETDTLFMHASYPIAFTVDCMQCLLKSPEFEVSSNRSEPLVRKITEDQMSFKVIVNTITHVRNCAK